MSRRKIQWAAIMTGTRVGPTRAEIVSMVAVVALVALGVFALWPRGGPAGRESGPAGRETSAQASGPAAIAVPDAELAPLRAAAALDPCPGTTGANPAGGVTGPSAAADPSSSAANSTSSAATGPLSGVTAACLGSPGTLDVGAALAGRPALINVWATWCGPCRAELPVLADYAARPNAVQVLGVDVRDDPRAALRLLADLGVRFPSVTDADSAVSAALDVPPVLPMSYLVRADGSLARVDPPAPFRTADEVATAIDRLMAR